MSSWLTPVAFGLAASMSTVLGGVLALRLAHRATALLAAAAGVVLGVAFFDLLPEALEAGEALYSHRTILAAAAAGFAGYLLVVRLFARAKEGGRWQIHLGPASLTMHSLIDGLVMGLAFRVSPEMGWVVALAVLTHDFADGVNTVSLAMMAERRDVATFWLVANGLAPLAGLLAGLLLGLPREWLPPIMAAFGGVFVYIGACELVPRSLLRDPRLRTTAAVLAGLAAMGAMTALCA